METVFPRWSLEGPLDISVLRFFSFCNFMATSAFKSTSRRGTTEPKAVPPPSRRRALSVSAVSRKTHLPFDDSNSITSEFSVKRDNPLFWTATSSPPDKDEVSRTNGEITFTNKKQSSYSNNSNARSSSASVSEQRGRSVTRSGSGAVKNGIGRSLSRVRGRSVSRAHDKGIYESENEKDIVTLTSARTRNKKEQVGNSINRTNSVRNMVDKQGGAKNSGLTTAHNQATEWSEDDSAFSLQISNLEDGLSTGSLSEAEEKTIKVSGGKQREGDTPTSGIYKTVRSEVRRVISDIQNDLESAFQKKNINTVTARDFPDMPPDFVNPRTVELVSDIRREYSMKLQESEERARKLRADLAIEEHRGRELNRILKEIIPDPNSSTLQKSRRGRRTSNERKRMSKRLNDEAMAYFDECVSLSTFDSSDFSAPEDPTYASVGATAPVGASSLVKGNQSNSCCYDQGSGPHQKQLLQSDEDSVTASSCEPGTSSQPFQFSFAEKQSENEDIRSYIKHFKKGNEKDSELEGKRSDYDAEEYNTHIRDENAFIDRFLYSNRIESGGLLLCGAALSFLPFASVL